MNNKSRLFNSARNVSVTLFIQLLSLIFSFASRTLFIKYLGSEFLGINGLYSNLLTMLSLAEMGVGTSIIYTLYKPLAEKNTEKLAALMNFYKTAYRVIALIVAVIGLAFVPFLDFFIKTDTEIPHLTLYYLLFLGDSVCSYFFIFKASIISADQRYYIRKTNNFIFDVITNILQIVVLVLTHNYTFYLVVKILCTLGCNISIAIQANKLYPFLKNNKARIGKEERNAIFKNVKSVFVYKFCGFFINNTDNILISKIVSTATVGLYSNYLILVNAVNTFVTVVFTSLTGSIGNLNATSTREESRKVFEGLNYFRFLIYGFCSVAFMSLLDSFIVLWIGTDYRLNSMTVIAIALNVYISGMALSTSDFRDTTGLFHQTKYILFFTAAINLGLSIFLGIKIGIAGILISTGISRILTNVWYEPYVLYRDYFKSSPVKYYLKQLYYLAITFIAYLPSHYFTKLIPEVTIEHFILKIIFTAIVPTLIIFAATFWMRDFKFLLSKVQFIIKSRKSK